MTATHATHRSMIKGWAAKPVSSITQAVCAGSLVEDTYYKLKSSTEGHPISISFTALSNDADHMVVRSSNFNTSDQVSGIYTTADCRKFWRSLVDAGFVAF